MLSAYPDNTINLIVELFEGLSIKWDSTSLAAKDRVFYENIHMPIIVHSNNGEEKIISNLIEVQTSSECSDSGKNIFMRYDYLENTSTNLIKKNKNKVNPSIFANQKERNIMLQASVAEDMTKD